MLGLCRLLWLRRLLGLGLSGLLWLRRLLFLLRRLLLSDKNFGIVLDLFRRIRVLDHLLDALYVVGIHEAVQLLEVLDVVEHLFLDINILAHFGVRPEIQHFFPFFISSQVNPNSFPTLTHLLPMTENCEIILTGGHGLLGSKIAALLPGCICPSKAQLDITKPHTEWNLSQTGKFSVLIHCAAKKMLDGRINPFETMITNVVGTANVAAFCRERGCKMVYISTDYVFRGDRGRYRTTDEVGPTNYYAETKLAGEYVVKCLPDHLILRLSFYPDVFPYDKAYVDQYITRFTASEAAERVVEVVRQGARGLRHLAGPRRSCYEFALATSGGKYIEPASMHDCDIARPVDSSLLEE